MDPQDLKGGVDRPGGGARQRHAQHKALSQKARSLLGTEGGLCLQVPAGWA